MNIEVRYYSKGGNTKKLAMAIAEELRVKALDLSYPVNKDTDILFLGSSVYWAGLDPEVKAYVNKLDPRKVKKIVNFSTAAIKESTYGQMKKLADKNGLNLSSEEFHCKGEFTALHKGKPDLKDIADVKRFAVSCVKNMEAK